MVIIIHIPIIRERENGFREYYIRRAEVVQFLLYGRCYSVQYLFLGCRLRNVPYLFGTSVCQFIDLCLSGSHNMGSLAYFFLAVSGTSEKANKTGG